MNLANLLPYFAGAGALYTLSVPTFTSSGTSIYPVSADGRVRFNSTNGNMEGFSDASGWTQKGGADAWIHSSAKDPVVLFDASDYEVRYISVSGSGLSNQHVSSDTWYTSDPGAGVGWITLTSHGFWGIEYLGDNETRSVVGTMQIRQISDTSNLASGTVTISAQQEGPS